LTGGSADASTVAEGRDVPLGSAPTPAIRLVTDDYFEAIGMPIVSGRTLRGVDIRTEAPKVVVINERLAAALWPGENAVGKRLSTWAGPDDPEWREVIGVVRDARSFGQSSPVSMELFIPYTQAPFGAWMAFQRSMVLVLRTSEGWPDSYVPLIRRAVRDVDSSLPVYDVRTMESFVVGSTANRRFYMRLVLMLALTGLGLAMLGVYGVIAYFVTQRTPEIGLRRAMGAQRREVVGMVIGQGLRTTLIGIAIGVPAALIFTRVMTSLLYEIEPTDLMTFVSVTMLLILISLVAAVIPSMKAAGVDPIVALRHD
jgi:putative ABC transport system permease protein